MSYTPTTDEVDTGFTTFAWDLERRSPGEYPEGSNFHDYHQVCAAFRRWLRNVKREAWVEGAEAAFYDPEIRGFVDYPDNPYEEQQ